MLFSHVQLIDKNSYLVNAVMLFERFNQPNKSSKEWLSFMFHKGTPFVILLPLFEKAAKEVGG